MGAGDSMIDKTQTLQQMLQAEMTQQDFDQASEDTHSIVKLIVTTTLQERLHDFLHIMTAPERRDYTMNLFETISTTPFYDFSQPDGGRFILIWQLESVADEEELIEYFTECMQQFNQAFGDVIVDIMMRETMDQILRLYTHEDQIMTAKIKPSSQKA